MRQERGAATMAMIGIAVVLAVAGVGAASLSTLYTARAQAVVAADAAALAAAPATFPPTGSGSPFGAARAMAISNGAELVGCQCRIDSTFGRRVVRVQTIVNVSVPIFGNQRVGATSRAEFDPRAWLGR